MWKEIAAIFGDILAAIAYVINGKPADKKRFSKTPPANWHKATPEADVPQRKAKVVRVDLDAYTPEEILEMSESEYRQKIGLVGVHSWEQAQKEAKKQMNKKARKSNAHEVEIEL